MLICGDVHGCCYLKIKQALSFAIVVGEVVEVQVDVDHAHVLEPSGVGIGVVIQIQDGGPEQFPKYNLITSISLPLDAKKGS